MGCFVLTVSDTLYARYRHERAGHPRDAGGSRARRDRPTIVRDEPADVATAVRDGLDTPDTRVVITTGGTGITAARLARSKRSTSCSRNASTDSASCSGC